VSGGSQNTVSQTTVPAWLQPYMTAQAGSGEALVQGGGPQYYPGQQVAGLTPLQGQGIQGVENTATSPNASTMADQQNQMIESGAYLNPSTNPYLAGTLQTAEQGVQNPITSEFGAAGRNVLASAPVQSSAMNQLANQIYGGAYQSGMQNMVQASYAAPSLDQGTYLPSQELMQTGADVQQQNQNQINAAMQQYNYTQQLPENMLSWYSGLLGNTAAPFGSSSSQGSSTMNPWLTGAGAATALYGSGAASGLMGSLGALGSMFADSDGLDALAFS
jgi:hypothetical protein